METSPSGTVRSTAAGKVDYSLVRDGPMYERWAVHLSKGGAESLDVPRMYPKRNWLLAETQEDLERFKESASRSIKGSSNFTTT